MVTQARTIDVTVGGPQGRASLVMGSYEPDDQTTGVPAGTSLTTLSGNQVITTPNTTLFRRDITGKVSIRAANVSVLECRVRGTNADTSSTGLIDCTNSACVNAIIEDCTITPDLPGNVHYTGILGHDYIARRNRIYNTCDGFGVFETGAPGTDSLVTIEANSVGPLGWWYPDPDHSDGSHNDCIQLQGGIGTIVRWNRLYGYQSMEVGDAITYGGREDPRFDPIGNAGNPTQTQTMSGVMMNANVGDPYDVEIYENWVYGGEFGLNISDDNLGVPGQTVAYVKRNRFDRGQWFVGFPIIYEASATFVIPASGVDKNYYMDNGAAVTLHTG